MSKIISLMIGIFVLFSIVTIASAVSIQDSIDDVAHWSTTTGGYGWTSVSVDNRPNIDIKQLNQNVVGETMVFELEVDGTIQDSQLNYYWATFNTSDSYYWFSWSNGQGGGIATNLAEFRMDAEPEITATGDTITAVFDIVGEDTTATEFWGYAWEYSTFGNVATAEWWGDWAPEDFTPFDDEDIVDSIDEDQDSGGSGTSDQNSNNNDQKTSTQTDTPGFELIILLAAVVVFLFIRKKK